MTVLARLTLILWAQMRFGSHECLNSDCTLVNYFSVSKSNHLMSFLLSSKFYHLPPLSGDDFAYLRKLYWELRENFSSCPQPTKTPISVHISSCTWSCLKQTPPLPFWILFQLSYKRTLLLQWFPLSLIATFSPSLKRAKLSPRRCVISLILKIKEKLFQDPMASSGTILI